MRVTPETIITAYLLIAPLALSCCALAWAITNPRQVLIVAAAGTLLEGTVDDSGTTISVPENGALFLGGARLQPGIKVRVVRI
jgi:hypothetical protein